VLASEDLPIDRLTFAGVGTQAAATVGVPAEIVLVGDRQALSGELQRATGDGSAVVLVPGALGEEQLADEVAAGEGAPSVVWLDLEAAVGPRARYLDPVRVCSIRGRGLGGLSWAIRSAVARASWPVTALSYGPDPEQVGDLRLPAGHGAPVPVCVLLHGGHWREIWERDLMDELAVDLTRRGFATWNLEYRRVGPSRGGWPATFADTAAGIDHLVQLADRYRLDLERVVLVGHSAGGQLAMWSVTRRALPTGAVGGAPAVSAALVVSLAGVPDLAHSARLGIDQQAVVGMIGGLPAELPERYALASPAERLPLECPCLLVWGGRDSPDIIEENRLIAARAQESGHPFELCELADADHFSVIDPRSESWTVIAQRMAALGWPGPEGAV
jgi:acetyl esterase/lipase